MKVNDLQLPLGLTLSPVHLLGPVLLWHHFLCLLCSLTALPHRPGTSKAMLLPPGLPVPIFTDSPGPCVMCATSQHFLEKESYLRHHKERGYWRPSLMAVTQETRIIQRETLLIIDHATLPSFRWGDTHTLPMQEIFPKPPHKKENYSSGGLWEIT